jgi:hypothetical protein
MGTYVTKDANGTLRWAHQYSPSIKLIVVHHTAIANAGDSRPGVEKVRALYAYHANSRGWGDIGYHYVIDSDGQIYQGKAGGDYVVGGHAYCNNIGTIGIAMLGNFDEEDPSEAQVHSLQWLINDLADVYNINVNKQVEFHGVMRTPVVGHRDLLSTDCPGYFLYGALDQVRSNVIAGNLVADVSFPPPPSGSVSSKQFVDTSQQRKTQRLIAMGHNTPLIRTGVTPIGSTALTGRPGDQMIITTRYIAPSSPPAVGSPIALVQLSDPTMTVFEDINGSFVQTRNQLTLPSAIPANGSMQIRLKVQFPVNPGPATMKVDQTTYSLVASGRRQLGARGNETLPNSLVLLSAERADQRKNNIHPISNVTTIIPSVPNPIPPANPNPISSASSSSAMSPISNPYSNPNPTSIRILLSYPNASADLTLANGTSVHLANVNGTCAETSNGQTIANGIVRIDGGAGITKIASWNRPHNTFRGVIECRIINGTFSLINELSIESYMAGLGEEPDTEPFEKQRAFAIAARTYAAYYLSPDHRKIPGAPYDGTDSAALFQRYEGAGFETDNPNWARAVLNTSGQVLTVNNTLIKPPYFSSDNGRTRSPSEAGWGNFPFAQIFASKPDPWCTGMTLNGHGVGMSGCGAKGQALAGKSAEQILQYYYPGAALTPLNATILTQGN